MLRYESAEMIFRDNFTELFERRQEQMEEHDKNAVIPDITIDTDKSEVHVSGIKKHQGLLNSVLWLGTVILYFLISMNFGHWHFTWLMFVSASVGSVIIDMLVSMEEGNRKAALEHLHGILWLCSVIVYFVFSFTFGRWGTSWLIFPAAALVSILLNFFIKENTD